VEVEGAGSQRTGEKIGEMNREDEACGIGSPLQVSAIITGLVASLWKAEQASGQLMGRTFNLGRLMVKETIDII
jgi:hypothetical protein